MSQYSYKPFQKTDSLPKDKLETLIRTIDENWKILDVKSHHFLTLGKFILFFNNTAELAEQVSIKIKAESENDLPNDIPEEIIRKIEKLKREYDLTEKQIAQLIKKTQQKKFKKLEIAKQIEHLEKEAKLSDQQRRKKTLDKFINSYDKFFSVLSPDLYYLNKDQKKEVTIKLENMQGVISDIKDGLL